MQERLIANSVVSDRFFWNGTPCWEWIGKYVYSNRGLAYGQLNVRIKSGPRKGKVRSERAHRVALRAFKGRYLGKRYVGGHSCNISWCINPDHLVGGTQQANVRKTVREGRHRNQYNPQNAQPLLEAAFDGYVGLKDHVAYYGDLYHAAN